MKKFLIFFTMACIISLDLVAAQPPLKPANIKDPYIPMLSFLDAFIAGGYSITAPVDTVIRFPSLDQSEPHFSTTTKQAIEWLEKAYKETESLNIECDLYKKVRRRQRLLNAGIIDATQQTLANLSPEEKLHIQLQRTEIFKLFFCNSETTIDSALAQEIERLTEQENEALKTASGMPARDDLSWYRSILRPFEKQWERRTILTHFVTSRFKLLQALKSEKRTEINTASQETYVSPDFFPPLKEFLEKEQPQLIKMYAKKAATETAELIFPKNH